MTQKVVLDTQFHTFKLHCWNFERTRHLFALAAHLRTAEIDYQIQIFVHQIRKPQHQNK